MTNRMFFIDNLKAFLILLVVLGHCIQNVYADYDTNTVFRFIYSFHMPLFMFISGYLNYKEHLEFKTIKKRFVSLIIPFFLYAVLSWILGAKQVSICVYILNVILHPDGGLWFLWVLFFLILFTYVARFLANILKIKEELVLLAIIVLLYCFFLLFPIKYLGIQFISWYSFFFFGGYILKKFKKKYTSSTSLLKNKNIVLMGIFFIFFASFWMRKEPPLFAGTFMFFDTSYFLYTYKMFVAILGILFFYCLFARVFNENYKFFTKLGNETLGVYALHLYVISYCSEIMINRELKVILLFIFSLIISLLIIKILKLTKLTRFFFLGSR